MKYLLASLLCIFAGSTIAADADGNIAIWGAGQKSCFSYSKARKSEDDGYFRYYIMGYLTAYNALTPDTYRLSGDKSLSDILAWLDDYCEKQAVHGFDQALNEFIIAHYPTRYRRPPGSGRR